MQCVIRAWLLVIGLFAIVPIARAGAGAYLVDDASITPARHCQVQSWAQWVSGGQKTLNTLPACSTGPVEWSLGLEAQNRPYEYQQSPAVKWMIRDPDHHQLGIAVNVGMTWASGRLQSRNTYMATTWTPDSARRWAINADLGMIYTRGNQWHALTGIGIKYKLREHLAFILEHIQPWNGESISQAGLRWVFHGSDSLDLIVGRSNAHSYNHWLTLGLNIAL